MPKNEPLIPAIQRQIRTKVGAAGDTAGNFLHANAKTVQDAASRAARASEGLGRTASGSGRAAGTYAEGLGRAAEGYAAALGRRVEGAGRTAGGWAGDGGNRVKDASGAPGRRMQTVGNPLGLRGKRTV